MRSNGPSTEKSTIAHLLFFLQLSCWCFHLTGFHPNCSPTCYKVQTRHTLFLELPAVLEVLLVPTHVFSLKDFRPKLPHVFHTLLVCHPHSLVWLSATLSASHGGKFMLNSSKGASVNCKLLSSVVFHIIQICFLLGLGRFCFYISNLSFPSSYPLPFSCGVPHLSLQQKRLRCVVFHVFSE